MLKIRRSSDRLIFNMGITMPGKDSLYIDTWPKSRGVYNFPPNCLPRVLSLSRYMGRHCMGLPPRISHTLLNLALIAGISLTHDTDPLSQHIQPCSGSGTVDHQLWQGIPLFSLRPQHTMTTGWPQQPLQLGWPRLLGSHWLLAVMDSSKTCLPVAAASPPAPWCVASTGSWAKGTPASGDTEALTGQKEGMAFSPAMEMQVLRICHCGWNT